MSYSYNHPNTHLKLELAHCVHTEKKFITTYPSFYFLGPLAFMFHSTHEQNYIGHVLAFSLCIGHFKNDSLCQQNQPKTNAERLKINEAGNNFNILELTLVGIALILIIISGLMLIVYLKRKAKNSENESVESGNTS